MIEMWGDGMMLVGFWFKGIGMMCFVLWELIKVEVMGYDV